MHRYALPLAAAAALAASASAQLTLVTPAGYAAAEGGANNAFPWSRGTASTRIQFIVDSSHFTSQGVTSPIIISQLRYRADAAATTVSWAGGTWPQVRIDLATCPLDYTAFSTTFASNLGADLTTVHNGPVTVVGGAGNGAGVPGPWYITIPLSTPFVYDPTSGNDLTVDIHQDGTGWSGSSRGADHVSTGVPASLGSRVYSTTATALTDTVASGSSVNYGAVTEFTYVPANGLFAGFSANVTSGASPLAVQFTDNSFSSAPGGVTSWAWDFDGDSVVDSTLQNPTHTYTACGSYTVSLTVNDGVNPPSTLTRTSYIVTDEVTPSFTFAPIAPGIFQFTDTSTPPATSWAWDFNGDAVIDSTAQNPVWAFTATCGAAAVDLTVNRLCKGPFSTSQSVALSPNTFTTTMAGGNGLSAAGSGNTFDIQVTNPAGVTICALEMAPYSTTAAIGAPLGCTVWVTDAPGGYLANHTNAAVWRQVATGTGAFAGGTFSAPVPVLMTLSNPIYVPQGTFGMAVHMTAGAGVAYTNATAPFTYPGTDLNIIAGNGKGAPFSTTANAGRAWNGILHYSTPSNGGLPGYGFFGAGCPSTLPTSKLTAMTQPVIGSTLTVDIDNLPFSLAFMISGLSNTVATFGPLPLDIGILGAPGCNARVSLDLVDTCLGANNTATWNLPLPNNAALLGFLIYNQAMVFDPAANAFGFALSDAHAALLGN